MSIIDKFKDLLEAIKRKNADTTRYDLDEKYAHRALPLLTDALMHVGMF